MADLATSDAVTQYRALINAGFNGYKILRERAGTPSGSAPGAATYVLGAAGQVMSVVGSANAPAERAFYLDPADFAVTGRDSKLRVRGGVFTNATAPATTWTVGLYPVATWGGTSGNPPWIATLSAVVAGSTVAVATPSANTANQGNSGDFAIPVAGWYVLAVVNSGAAAANSQVAAVAALQLRQV